MQFTYGGPHAPRVSDAWGGQTSMYYQMLAQRGIAVWICDNRSASGKGVAVGLDRATRTSASSSCVTSRTGWRG